MIQVKPALGAEPISSRADSIHHAVFFTRRQLHHWAARVLFLWLFGVFVGVANACVTPLATPEAREEAVVASAMEAAAAHADHGHGAMAHHADAGAANHDSGDGSGHGASPKSNCSDFCDKASSSIRSLKYTGDDFQAQALQLPAVAAVLTLPAYESVQPWVPRRDGVRAPPIPIAFLRLAL